MIDEFDNSAERLLWDEFRRSGCCQIREQLLHLHEPFARSIAARMYGARIDNSVSFDDYLQYGRIGLVEAIDRFDCERGVSFGAYSSARIRGAILNGISKESEVAAQHRFWRIRVKDRVESLRTAVAADADRASLADIATITIGLAVGVLLQGTEENAEPADQNPCNNPYAVSELHQVVTLIKRLIIQLPPKECEVISAHYIDGFEFQQVAERLGVTKGRISQIHAQALLRLRTWLEQAPKLDRKL